MEFPKVKAGRTTLVGEGSLGASGLVISVRVYLKWSNMPQLPDSRGTSDRSCDRDAYRITEPIDFMISMCGGQHHDFGFGCLDCFIWGLHQVGACWELRWNCLEIAKESLAVHGFVDLNFIDSSSWP